MIKFNWEEALSADMGNSQHTLYEDKKYGAMHECVLSTKGIDLVYFIDKEEGTEFVNEEELRKEIEKRIKEGKLIIPADPT